MHAITITVPVKTQNESNGPHGNHFVKANRRRDQRTAVWAAMNGSRPVLMELRSWPRWRITLTRVAPSNGLDDDGLRTALKSARDEVTKQLGVGKTIQHRQGARAGTTSFREDDRDPRLTWLYDQRKGPYAVVVRFEMGAA